MKAVDGFEYRRRMQVLDLNRRTWWTYSPSGHCALRSLIRRCTIRIPVQVIETIGAAQSHLAPDVSGG